MSSLTAARMSYAAALVASVTYGLYVAIAAHTAYRLLRLPKLRRAARTNVLLAWVLLMFIVQTVYYIAGSKWSELEFVETTEDPGIFAGQLSSRLAILKDTTYTISIWLADAFILYRALSICADRRVLVIVPALLYLGSIVCGIGLLVETARPGAVFGQAAVIDFGTPFWSISVSMNVLTTLVIAGRIVYGRDTFAASSSLAGLSSARSPGRQNAHYYGSGRAEVAIFLESAALYAVCSIVYIPMFAKNIALQFPFSALLVSAASIAPHLIILRMVGREADSARFETSLVPLQKRVGDDLDGRAPQPEHGDAGSLKSQHDILSE